MSPALAVLALLPAALGATTAAGPEFQINSHTPESQRAAAVSHDATGNFVMTWHSYGQDGDSQGVFGRRFNNSGGALGAEFQVNSYTTERQFYSAVSHDSAGNFIVVWGSIGQDGSSWGIFGQRLDSSGSALGAEFQVNSYTSFGQYRPAVSHDSAGNFVVTWFSLDQDGDHYGVFGQRFNSTGIKLGPEFQVNSYTTAQQRRPKVSHDSVGNFVVVWESYGQDGSQWGVFAQRFDSSGSPIGTEFRVNSFTSFQQRTPAISHDAAGNFVVVWDSSHGYNDVFGQRFDSAGGLLGGEFQVSSFMGTSVQQYPVVSHDSAGNFVVTWESYGQDGSDFGVFGQRFDSTGGMLGSEFQANSHTAAEQCKPALSHDSAGNFVVAWTSYGQDGSYNGIFGQRFDTLLTVGPGAGGGSKVRILEED